MKPAPLSPGDLIKTKDLRFQDCNRFFYGLVLRVFFDESGRERFDVFYFDDKQIWRNQSRRSYFKNELTTFKISR